MFSNLNTTIISKLDLEKLLSAFCQFSVDVCLVLCRIFVYLLSIFPRFNNRNSVCNLSVLSRVFTSGICACGFVHPQAVPLIVSYHLLKVPLIVSWRNVIICNRACTVIWILQSFRNSISRSFYLFLSIFFQCLLGVVSNLRLFAVDISSV